MAAQTKHLKSTILGVKHVFFFFKYRSIEKSADHEAKRLEQIAKGSLERQKLINQKVGLRSVSLLAAVFFFPHR